MTIKHELIGFIKKKKTTTIYISLEKEKFILFLIAKYMEKTQREYTKILTVTIFVG